MMGEILEINPRASMVDFSHEIPPGDAASNLPETSLRRYVPLR